MFNFRLHAFTPSEKNLDWFGSSFKKFTVAAIIASASMTTNIIPAHARPEGVNRPDLLPSEKGVALIDVANFLR